MISIKNWVNMAFWIFKENSYNHQNGGKLLIFLPKSNTFKVSLNLLTRLLLNFI